MQLTKSGRGGIQILVLVGRMMGGPDTDRYRDTVRDLVDANHNRLLIDLSGVDWINSSGLGALICSYATVTRAGGQIAFTGMDKVRQIIEMTCLHEVLEVYESREEAVADLLATSYE